MEMIVVNGRRYRADELPRDKAADQADETGERPAPQGKAEVPAGVETKTRRNVISTELPDPQQTTERE